MSLNCTQTGPIKWVWVRKGLEILLLLKMHCLPCHSIINPAVFGHNGYRKGPVHRVANKFKQMRWSEKPHSSLLSIKLVYSTRYLWETEGYLLKYGKKFNGVQCFGSCNMRTIAPGISNHPNSVNLILWTK